MSIFPKIALFHIYCYFIGKVSPMYGFLASFSSPESIFADINYLFHILSQLFKKQEICHFFSKIAEFHINCYFIGKVSLMYGFLADLFLRNPFLLKKLLISCFVTTFHKTGLMSFFFQNRIISHQLLLHR